MASIQVCDLCGRRLGMVPVEDRPWGVIRQKIAGAALEHTFDLCGKCMERFEDFIHPPQTITH